MGLYGICISFPAQKALSEQFCHGPKCGKGIFAFLDAGPGIGVVLPCRHDSCPIQESLLEDTPLDVSREYQGEAGAEQMILRKLKAPLAPVPESNLLNPEEDVAMDALGDQS